MEGIRYTADVVGLDGVTAKGPVLVEDEAGKRLPVTTYGASGAPISSTEGEGNLVDLSGATVADGSLTIDANGEYAIIDTAGAGGLALTVSGFGTATLAVQWSNLTGSGFTAGLVGTVGTIGTGTTITADGQYTAAAGGRYARIIATAYTSGTLVITPVLVDGGASSSSGSGDVNLTEIGGSAVDVGNGVVGSATQRVAIASNSSMPLGTGAATAALQSSVQNTFGAITAERTVIYDANGDAVSYTDTVPTKLAANPSSDTTLTRVLNSISTATDTAIVTATAAQTTRVYRLILTCTGANVLTFKSASTAIFPVITFGSSGGSVTLDYTGYWWMTTATNEALNLTTTTTAAVSVATDYIKGA